MRYRLSSHLANAHVLAVLAALLIAPGTGSASENQTYTETELQLSSSDLVVELDNAEVLVEQQDAVTPMLRVQTPSGLSAVLHRQTADATRLQRSPAAEAEGMRLHLALVLTPEQSLSVSGRDLRLRIEGLPPSEEEEPQLAEEEPQLAEEAEANHEEELPASPTPPSAASLQITADDSEVELGWVEQGTLTMTGGYLQLHDCRGRFELNLSGGAAEIHRHQEGTLQVSGTLTDLTVTDSSGTLAAILQGGSLVARGGQGPLGAQVNEALVQVIGWRGQVSLRGADSGLTILGGTSSRLIVEGERLDTRVDSWTGPVIAKLDGGNLEGSTWNGTSSVDASNGTTLDITEVSGQVVLTLHDDVFARLGEVPQRLQVTVQRSELEVDGAGSLALTAEDAVVTARSIHRLEQLQVLRSELDLDLSAQRGKLDLTLQAGSRARVALTSPCEVQTLGPGAMASELVTITGCIHRLPMQGATLGRRGLRGEYQVRLNVTMEPDTELEVDGR